MPENKPTPPQDDADPARAVLRTTDRAALSTLEAESGAPYGSIVMLGLDHDATPLLLLSDLSQHARNLAVDARAALLIDGTVAEPPLPDPLTGPRVTLMGRILREAAPERRARYLARHPAAGFYAGFADFHLYRFEMDRGHFVAGFGKVRWIERDAFLLPDAPAFRDVEAQVLAEIAQDWPDRLAHAAGAAGTGWAATGLDPEGLDLRAAGRIARLAFPQAVRDHDSAWAAINGLLG
jgi:putative heme iron utilization protein